MTQGAQEALIAEYGHKGEDFNVVLDGEPVTVAIYTKLLNEEWAEGTVVDNHGHVLSRQSFPRKRYKL